MSHVVSIELKINDLSALARAAEECGCELVRDVKTYRWYGRHVGDYPLPNGFAHADLGKCDHVIRLRGKGSKDAYEIGVVKLKDGSGYTCLYDFFEGGYGLMEAVSSESDKKRQGIGKLLQHYTAEVTRRQLRKQGFRVVERLNKNGQLVIQGVQ